MSLYAELTNGKSVKLSKTFIRGQKLSLVFVRHTDRIAAEWIRAGVPIVESDMVDMAEIPNFQKQLAFKPQGFSEFKVLKVRELKMRLRKAFKESGFVGTKIQAEKEFLILGDSPTFHVMARHMLESLIRTCSMAPIYEEMASERNLPSTLKLSKKMIQHHLVALNGCRRIDKLAAVFQAEGIPIIHQDVPHITPYAIGFSNSFLSFVSQ